MTGAEIATWPGTRELDVSQAYVNMLIHADPPRLRAVRTRLGWLIDPASVAAFKAERERRQQKRSA
jgi:hypothetical protein